MLQRIMTAPAETVRINRTFPAAPDAVFRAWTDPAEFKAWWQPRPYRTAAVEMDVRVGGAYRVAMRHPEGAHQYLFGVYREVRSPDRLAMTWCLAGSEKDDGYEALLTLEFREKPGGTELVLIHEKLPGASIEMYAAGWSEVLGSLSRYLT
jgi:uncharacterized protein YndB with AHSA1/START domain